MTIKTYFWDDTVLGDASEAPYSSAVFTRLYSKLLISDAGDGYVIPDYANELEVTEAGVPAATVEVNTGFLYAKGIMIENDAVVTVTIAANAAGNPRLDRIVVDIDWATQTASITVVQGTAGASPALPALTQTYGTQWQIPLAYIWVADGFATIDDEEIHDVRVFAPTAFSMSVGGVGGHLPNLIQNSEFMSFSETPVASKAPDIWSFTGTGTAGIQTKPANMPRGRAIRYTATGGGVSIGGMEQVVPVIPEAIYTLKFLYQINTGYGRLDIQTGATTNPVTLFGQKFLRRDSWTEETVVITIPAGHAYMRIRVGAIGNDIVDFGQVLVVQGYHPGPFRAIPETIIFNTPITDAAWNITAKSSGNTLIDLDADFQIGGNTPAPEGTMALYIKSTAKDSGSAAGVASLRTESAAANGVGTDLLLDGVVNDKDRSQIGWIPLIDSQGWPSRNFRVIILATGAGTLDATVELLGMKT
jgi:hypothetical protein